MVHGVVRRELSSGASIHTGEVSGVVQLVPKLNLSVVAGRVGLYHGKAAARGFSDTVALFLYGASAHLAQA